MAFWSTKAALSLKRVKIQEKLLWGSYRNSPTVFRTAPSPTPYRGPTASRSPKLGSHLTQISNRYYLRNGQSYGFQIWPVYSQGPSEQNRMNNFGEMEAWTAQIFRVPPIISGTGKATDFKFGQYIQRVHPNKIPLKILEERERGCIQGLPIFFGYPLLSQEREKLRISNLASIFRGAIRTKSH